MEEAKVQFAFRFALALVLSQNMASFHRRKVKSGYSAKEKSLDLCKQRSKLKKEELIDSKRAIPLGELLAHEDSKVSGKLKLAICCSYFISVYYSGEAKPVKREKFLQRIYNWRKSRQKKKLREKCSIVMDGQKAVSSCVEDKSGEINLVNAKFPLQKLNENVLDFKLNFTMRTESVFSEVQSKNKIQPEFDLPLANHGNWSGGAENRTPMNLPSKCELNYVNDTVKDRCSLGGNPPNDYCLKLQRDGCHKENSNMKIVSNMDEIGM